MAILCCLLLISAYILWQPYTWGDNSALSITIKGDKPALIHDGIIRMHENDTLNLIINLTNTGDHDLRILTWGINICVFYLNDTVVDWIGPVYAPPPPPKNSDLYVLKAGDSIIKTGGISVSFQCWDLKINQTYKVVGLFNAPKEDSITLPYWTGAIKSDDIIFMII